MRIAFISGMSGFPWGGSEILWSQAALRLRGAGHDVFASVHGWPETPAPLLRLREAGIVVSERRWVRASRKERLCARLLRRPAIDPGYRPAWEGVTGFKPDLVCVSQGGMSDGVEWMERCGVAGIPYACVVQANGEWMWPGDKQAERLRESYSKARRAFFVSEGNLRLFELQCGALLKNSEVVRNPFQVPFDSAPPWPGDGEPWRLACVGRLEPSAKGQDLLLQVLARQEWKSRRVEVSFVGTGPCEQTLQLLVNALDLGGRVKFTGHVNDVRSIWSSHHALVLPSRYEGLPLAMVEAMLCNRVCIVTDVAGNAELLQDNTSGFVAAAPTVRHLAEAMERAWNRRSEWRAMGEAAGAAARAILPPDPASVFAEKLLALI